jgi:uncharacterized integral membrane protein
MTAPRPDADPQAKAGAGTVDPPAAATDPPVASPATAEPSPQIDRSVPRTRIGTAYVALVSGLVVLVVLLVFILENTRTIPITFFGATGRLPLGVALLLAAVAGALILGVVGTVRIGQLRRRVRRARMR